MSDVITELAKEANDKAMEIARLKAENAKLREACSELLKIAERHDPEWLHWPEMHEELRKLGVVE